MKDLKVKLNFKEFIALTKKKQIWSFELWWSFAGSTTFVCQLSVWKNVTICFFLVNSEGRLCSINKPPHVHIMNKSTLENNFPSVCMSRFVYYVRLSICHVFDPPTYVHLSICHVFDTPTYVGLSVRPFVTFSTLAKKSMQNINQSITLSCG